jgi:hypothetical protein
MNLRYAFYFTICLKKEGINWTIFRVAFFPTPYGSACEKTKIAKSKQNFKQSRSQKYQILKNNNGRNTSLKVSSSPFDNNALQQKILQTGQ